MRLSPPIVPKSLRMACNNNLKSINYCLSICFIQQRLLLIVKIGQMHIENKVHTFVYKTKPLGRCTAMVHRPFECFLYALALLTIFKRYVNIIPYVELILIMRNTKKGGGFSDSNKNFVCSVSGDFYFHGIFICFTTCKSRG